MDAPFLPESKAALIADARQAARMARGRAAFVQRERLLPIGVPVGVAAATMTYRSRRRHGHSEAAAWSAAAGALCVALGVVTGAAFFEWDLRKKKYRASHSR